MNSDKWQSNAMECSRRYDCIMDPRLVDKRMSIYQSFIITNMNDFIMIDKSAICYDETLLNLPLFV